MVSWFLLTLVLFLLARLPFLKVPLIPYYVEYMPAIALAPLVGVFWGPAGALGVAAGSLAGDMLYGYWGLLSPYRALGLFLYAYSAWQLWDYSMMRLGRRGGLDPNWGQTVRFLMVSWPGCFAAAVWPALGADQFRFYPLTYVASLLLFNNLLFVTLLGPAFYRILARELVPHFGCWRDVMGEVRPMTGRGAVLHLVGSIGCWVVVIFAGGMFYEMWPTQAAVLGSTTGRGLQYLVLPFLLMQVAGLCLCSAAEVNTPHRKTPRYA
jgi:energy-coupling factor transport system substrate-specific component